jgi:hypothetical protein
MLTDNQDCDLLIKEGINGRQDQDAFIRTCLLTRIAVELGRRDALARARAWHEQLDKKGMPGKLAVELDYSRANAIAGDRYGTEWQWEQVTLAKEIFYLRRAISREEFAQVDDVTKCLCFNNLGNRMKVAGRIVEALDCWRRALEVLPTFGMSLCNRAIGFANYVAELEDPGIRALFVLVAHKEATAALAPAAIYTSPHDGRTVKSVQELKRWIESLLDLKGISAHDPDPLAQGDDPSQTKEEQDYRRWCLATFRRKKSGEK